MSGICGFILAAGEGRRMRPYTFVRPKAMLPFCGVPLLELALDELFSLPEIGRCIVNGCHLASQVEEGCTRHASRHSRAIHFSREESLLNHGGGLLRGMERFGEDASTLLVRNVDVVHDYNLRGLLEFHRSRQADVTALLIPNHRRNGVLTDDGGRILDFHNDKGTLTFSGIYLLERSILDFLPDTPAPSIIDAFTRAAAAGRKILGFIGDNDHLWSDVGTPAEYIRAHARAAGRAFEGQPMLRNALLEQARRRFALEADGIHCTGATGLGTGLTLPSGTHLHNVVIWDGVTLSAPALYAEGVICESQPVPVVQASSPSADLLKTTGAMPDSGGARPRKQGSGRDYRRLSSRDHSTGILWSSYSLGKRENSAFASVAHLLSLLGIPVPAILLHLPERGELALEDLGDEDLLNIGHDRRITLLPQVLAQAARLHAQGAEVASRLETPLQPPFTPGYYQWEQDYFRWNLLDDLLGMGHLWNDGVAREAEAVRTRMLGEPQVLLHRDFQAANIKIHHGACHWIDFQGMRLGAAGYDIASLLYDPYVEYTPEERLAAWDGYRREVIAIGGRAPEPDLLHIAAIQRLMQALGAYARLWQKNGLDWYRPFILTGMRHLRQAAGAAKAFPAIEALASTLETLVPGK